MLDYETIQKRQAEFDRMFEAGWNKAIEAAIKEVKDYEREMMTVQRLSIELLKLKK